VETEMNSRKGLDCVKKKSSYIPGILLFPNTVWNKPQNVCSQNNVGLLQETNAV